MTVSLFCRAQLLIIVDLRLNGRAKQTWGPFPITSGLQQAGRETSAIGGLCCIQQYGCWVRLLLILSEGWSEPMAGLSLSACAQALVLALCTSAILAMAV